VGGCLAVTASTSVSINAIPVLVITDPAPVCAPSTVDLMAAGITAGSDAGLTFTYWSDAAGTVSYATPAAASTGTYYIMGTDALTGCSDIKPVSVTVSPVPVVIITDPSAVCSPLTVDLTAAGVTAGSDAGLTFTYWSDAAGTIPYATPSAATSGTYYIMGTDAVSGCSDIKPVTVSVNSAITVSFTQTNVMCNGASTGSIDITVSGGIAPYVYLWTGAGVAAGSEDQSNLSAGNYSVLVTDANSCSSVLLPVTITEPATALTASVTAQTPVSVYGGNDGSVTVDGSGGTLPYLYKIDAGAYQVSGIFTTLTAGAYTVTVEDANLCTVAVPVLITEPPAPISGTITQQTNVNCFGASSGSVTVAGTGGVTPYEYSLDAVTYQVSGTFGSLAAGSYTVTVRDAILNTFDVSLSITEPASALGGSTVSFTDILCFGNNTGSITVSGSGGVAPYQYKLGSGSYQPSGTFNSLNAGTYTVTIQDANLCTFDVTVTLNQPAGALAGSIAAQTNVSCFGGSNGSVTVQASGGTSPYLYSLNGAAYQPASSFSGLAAGNYTISVQDANSCSVNVALVLAEPAAIAIASEAKDATCPDEPDGSITLTITGGIPPYNVIWSDGVPGATRTNIKDGTYSAIVTDVNGCAASIDVVVGVVGTESCLKVQDIITPNNDGYNDTWKIRNIDLFPNAEVFVYTRWGKLVFNTKNISGNEWDGTYKGKLLPTDSYTYILRLNNGDEDKSGVVSIIR
jgi:gliding motility-associated-like protein